MRASYYRVSGKFSAPRLVGVIAFGLVVAIALAFAYAYAFGYIPIIGYISFLLAAGYGLAIGFLVAIAANVGHIRSKLVMSLVTLLVTSAGYYVSWAVWLHVVAGRSGVEIPISEIAGSPKLMWSLISSVNETGVWSMRGWTPSGGVLWLFWALEIVLIFGAAFVTTSVGLNDSAYCEACRQWCVDRSALDLHLADPGVVASQLEAGNIGVLTELPPRSPEELVWTRVDVRVCPTAACGHTNTLSVSQVVMGADDDGKPEEKAELYVDRLLIDRTSAEQLQPHA